MELLYLHWLFNPVSHCVNTQLQRLWFRWVLKSLKVFPLQTDVLFIFSVWNVRKSRNDVFVVIPWIGYKNLLHLSVLPKGEMGSEAETVEVMMKHFPHSNGTSCVCISLSQSNHLSTPPPISSTPITSADVITSSRGRWLRSPVITQQAGYSRRDGFHQWQDLKTHSVLLEAGSWFSYSTQSAVFVGL